MTDSIKDIQLGPSPELPLATTRIRGTSHNDAVQLDPRTLPAAQRTQGASSKMEILLLADDDCSLADAIIRQAIKAGHMVTFVTDCTTVTPQDGVRILSADRDADDFECLLYPLLRTPSGQPRFRAVVDCSPKNSRRARQALECLTLPGSRLILISNDLVYDPLRRDFPTTSENASYCTMQGSPWNDLRQAEATLANSPTDAPEWTILRPTMLLSSGRSINDFPPFLDRLNALKTDGEIKLPAAGHWLIQPIDADDLATIVLAVPEDRESSRAVIDCAGPVILEFRQLCEMAARLLGCAFHPRELPETDYLGSHPEYDPYLCHRIYRNEWRFSNLPRPITTPEESLRKFLN